ncbi:type IV pilus modification PilV family protein [Actinoplanes friuliensis]|jgi:prepilin-type N-terminal cleavage/methylation domain-containing protein|uniref:Prepilin-type N-terminal cleavage/methylation domain-containing protein n=1 Tax=Actinoplanes friuliensis DSM 7358 TaxID=1246995 RepID=U5VUR8_9ACTN|nr:type II secretion system protein [Actinoplanes friuliensis]AGZ39480.1 hypothetical protein AFR_05955 [Actinoplanes friuliensis DSM 7358]
MTRKAPGDAGFTLVEVLTALGVIGVVATAVTTFFVRSMVLIDIEGTRQTAIQVASLGMEQLRSQPAATALTWLTDHRLEKVEKVQPEGADGKTFKRWWDVPAAGSLIPATVHVTWTERGCTPERCSYTTTTMISTSTLEPVFDSVAK